MRVIHVCEGITEFYLRSEESSYLPNVENGAWDVKIVKDEKIVDSSIESLTNTDIGKEGGSEVETSTTSEDAKIKETDDDNDPSTTTSNTMSINSNEPCAITSTSKHSLKTDEIKDADIDVKQREQISTSTKINSKNDKEIKKTRDKTKIQITLA